MTTPLFPTLKYLTSSWGFGVLGGTKLIRSVLGTRSREEALQDSTLTSPTKRCRTMPDRSLPMPNDDLL